jgi:hypothetical protein
VRRIGKAKKGLIKPGCLSGVANIQLKVVKTENWEKIVQRIIHKFLSS